MRLRSFRKNTDGNMTMIFALVMPVALVSIGAAFDLTNAHNHNRRLQAAADAAALSVTLMPFGSTDAERDAAALASIEANMTEAGNWLSINSVDVTEITAPDGAPAFQVDVVGKSETTISQLMGINYVNQGVTSKAMQTAGGFASGAEIVMTMDVTSSMSFPTKDGGRSSSQEAYDAIQAAMNQLDALSGSDDFFISFFPLADRVNIGDDYRDWVLYGDHEDRLGAADWTPADYGVIGWEEPAPQPEPEPTPEPGPGEYEVGAPIFRVNAGSDAKNATDGGMQWGKDKTNSKSPYLANAGGNKTASTGSSINMSAVSTYGVPQDVFKVERWDDSGGSSMQWAFPVEAGQMVEVRLFLAETWSGANGKGKRVFDVKVDGVVPPVFDDIDQWDLAGGMNKGIVVSHQVESDGTVDLEFIHVIQNPAIKGIEIVNLSAPTPPEPEPVVVVEAAQDEAVFDFRGFVPPVDDNNYYDETTEFNWNGCVHPRYLGDSGDYGLESNAELPYFLSDVPPEGEGGVKFRSSKSSHKQNDDSGDKPDCNGQKIIGPLHTTTPIFDALPGLNKAGTGRFDIAMAWAWRMVSPNWQGMWGNPATDPSLATYPEDPASLIDPNDANAMVKSRRKIILMFTDGHTTAYDREFGYSQPWGYNNLTPEHVENLVAVCDAARSQGVEIYVFHVLGNGKPEVVQGFKDCVGGEENYSQDVEEYYHQIATFEDLEVGLGAMGFDGVTSILTD